MDPVKYNMTACRVVGSIECTEKAYGKDSVVIQEIWTIPTFKQLVNDKEIREINSPTFTESRFAECKFQLKIQFYRRLLDSALADDIFIYYMPTTQVFLETIQLTTLGDGPAMIPGTMTHKDYSMVEANKWRRLKRVSTTTRDQDGNRILSWLGFVKSLQFNFMFKVSVNRVIEEIQFQIPATRLSNDFQYLLLSGMFSDVVMRSAEDEEFRVHKAVLASRSAVLKAHFEHNTTETITNIVESHLESSVLREVLSFIYTDKAPKLDEIPEKLLAAADYYQLSRLKSLCEEALYKKLAVDNAIETLQLADLYSADTLKQISLELIKKDVRKFELFTKSEDWAKLDKSN